MGLVRVPDDLLDRLRAAAPPGTPIAKVVEEALALAGGDRTVRASIEAKTHRQGAVAAARRRVAAGYRDARMAPGDQVALAEAAREWVRALEEGGLRAYDPRTRRLHLAAPPDRGGTTPFRQRRRGDR